MFKRSRYQSLHLAVQASFSDKCVSAASALTVGSGWGGGTGGLARLADLPHVSHNY